MNDERRSIDRPCGLAVKLRARSTAALTPTRTDGPIARDCRQWRHAIVVATTCRLWRLIAVLHGIDRYTWTGHTSRTMTSFVRWDDISYLNECKTNERLSWTGWLVTKNHGLIVDNKESLVGWYDTAKARKPVLLGGQSSSSHLCLLGWNSNKTASISNVMCWVIHDLYFIAFRATWHSSLDLPITCVCSIKVDRSFVHLNSPDVNQGWRPGWPLVYSGAYYLHYLTPIVSMHRACSSLLQHDSGGPFCLVVKVRLRPPAQ